MPERARRAHFESVVRTVLGHWKPFLLIQGSAAVLVAAFYAVPAVSAFANQVADAKSKLGWFGTPLLAVVASIAVPALAKALTGLPIRMPRAELLFQIVFFALLGAWVDLFYSFLTLYVGSDQSLRTVVAKVAVDQFAMSLLTTIPFSVVAMRWKECGFSFARTRLELSGGGFWQRYAPLVLMLWAFWIPVLAAIFSLPRSLQTVLYLLVQAAWSLLLVGMTRERP